MILKNRRLAFGALFLVAACGDGIPAEVTQLNEPEPIRVRGTGPDNANPDLCYWEDASPAVIETVTEHALVQPAELAVDGTVLIPAIYKTETRQKIIEPRKDQWFETLCAEDMTPDFIASLQRALAARGHYQGPVNGVMTAATSRAIRVFQKPQGLDSAVLSLAAARQLGLRRVERIAR